jgi:hypothetical protein
MGIMDKKWILSDAQAILSTADSETIIDMNVANPNQGMGTPMYLHVVVQTAIVSAGSGELDVQLVECATSGGSYTEVLAAVQNDLDSAGADCPAGTVLIHSALPSRRLQRYLKMVYTVSTADAESGNIDAWIDMDG